MVTVTAMGMVTVTAMGMVTVRVPVSGRRIF
jgi:hypothetical protein